MEGVICGRYRIIEKLGAGGMADIYRARHELMAREAVVKLLRPDMSSRRQIVQRFLQEAQAANSIQHPGIVAIHDVGFNDHGRAYIVMELLHGETLGERLRRLHLLSADAAIPVIRQLADAVAAAHACGIVHRDLKPDNIFIVSDPAAPGGERVKVLDFGLAKLAMDYAGSLVTAMGSIFGTPGYMAPEQCKDSAAVDARADLYSIGCIFYRCLCGRPPFDAPDALAVLAAHLGQLPIPPRALCRDIPPVLEALILRLLEKSPDQRVQSCAELIAALDDSSPSISDISIISAQEISILHEALEEATIVDAIGFQPLLTQEQPRVPAALPHPPAPAHIPPPMRPQILPNPAAAPWNGAEPVPYSPPIHAGIAIGPRMPRAASHSSVAKVGELLPRPRAPRASARTFFLGAFTGLFIVGLVLGQITEDGPVMKPASATNTHMQGLDPVRDMLGELAMLIERWLSLKMPD